MKLLVGIVMILLWSSNVLAWGKSHGKAIRDEPVQILEEIKDPVKVNESDNIYFLYVVFFALFLVAIALQIINWIRKKTM